MADDIFRKTVAASQNPMINDMLLLQRETGMRPGEVCSMKWEDIDDSDDIWVFVPYEHKTEHHGKSRIIFLNSTCQEILEKYRSLAAADFFFTPERAKVMVRELKYPGRPIKNPKQRKYRSRYIAESYRNAVQRICEKHKIPK